jgi:Nucleolar protein 12 (25kDa)
MKGTSGTSSTAGKKTKKNVRDAHNSSRKQKRVTHIGFDPDARNEYLTGFSERKRQRRCYGLAMQKVKDRKSRLDQRAELKLAVKEQIIEAERKKASFADAAYHACNTAATCENEQCSEAVEADRQSPLSEIDPENVETKVQLFEDVHTKNQWGGDVIVTTTTDFTGDSDDDIVSETIVNRRKGSSDRAQEFSGKVERFIGELKGKMPSTKRDARRLNNRSTKHKGKHGALNMRGIGSDKNFKIAKKMLSRSQAKDGSRTKGQKR